MIWSDPIVEEVRRVRDAYAARFHYDLRAIYRDLKKQEQGGGHKIVSPQDATEDEANPTVQPTDSRPQVVAHSNH
jgi:hypothetical protein